MTNKPLILVTNDDGISAPGIHVLAQEMKAFGRVLVVAPEAWAYPGEGTLVYVIDILDVRNADQ